MFRSTNTQGRAALARVLSGAGAAFSLLTAATFGAKASAVSYPNFSSTAGLSLIGTASQSGANLRLTSANYSQRGSAWTTGKVYVKQGFNTTFTFQFGSENGPNGRGADGFTFNVQNVGNNITTAEGGTSGDVQQAVSVSIRDFANGQPGDVSDDAIRIFGNNQALVAALDLNTLGIQVHDDQPHTVTVAYDGANMSLTVDGKTDPSITNVPVALGTAEDANGLAYVGFGARTGGYFQTTDITSWTLTSPSPIAGLGLGGAFTYADFSSLAGLQLAGNALQSGSLIQLTQAVNGQSSGTWYNLREQVAKGFDTTFQFKLANENGGADGFSFNVTTDGFVTGGEGGVGSGSIAVGIDTYQNTGEPSNNFVKLINNAGAIIQTQDLYSLGINLHDDLPHTVAVHYDGTNISVTIDTVAVYTNVALPLGSSALADGTAIVGFAGRTGGLNEEIDLLSWSFSPPGATVTGSIALEGVPDLTTISPYSPLGTFAVTFRDATTGAVVNTSNVTLTTTGGSPNGTFSVSGVPAGTYNVVIKGAKNLGVLSPGVVISGSTGTIPAVILPAGDSNNDNFVDSSDFGTLVGAFNTDSAISGGGYDPTVDFNFDGLIDSSDFGLLIGEFNNAGAN